MYDTLHIAVHLTGPGSCRVTMAGELDVVSAPDVRDALRAAVSAHDRVEVDCGRLTFCDCFLRDHPSQYQAVRSAGGTSKAG
ncbi:STAS domain-containing protein [Streptomyces sp. NPDC001817]|uniref:STAS domain-containing protein n=1 Tax=Streptomyces sp. NPDC001817 TaxID=3154398 RepID=UPI003327A018